MSEFHRRPRMAAAALSLSLALLAAPAAQATTYFTATASPGTSFTLSDVLFQGFSFGFYDVRFSGACSQCIAATGADGQSLGTFNFQIGGSPWSYLQDPLLYPTTATRSYANGSEYFEGFGQVLFLNDAFTGPHLLSGNGNFSGFSIYASPGAGTATVEFNLDQFAHSDLVDLPSGPLYLQITGVTGEPVSIVNLTPDRVNPVYTVKTPLTFDFTVTLSDTRFTPGGGNGDTGGGPVPELHSWALMIAGFAATGSILRRRRRVAV